MNSSILREHLSFCNVKGRDTEMGNMDAFGAYPNRNTSGVYIRGSKSLQQTDKESVRGKLLVDVNSCSKAMVTRVNSTRKTSVSDTRLFSASSSSFSSTTTTPF